MDHTLVRYKTQAFEELAYKAMLDKLVGEKNYPKDVSQLVFSMSSVIRGLVIDRDRGNILKVSRHGAIRTSCHGTHPIDFKTQQRDYRGTYVDLSDPNFSSIDTAFSLSVAVLFAQLVDLKDAIPHQMPEYSQILQDVIEVMDLSHRDDSLKSIVRKEMDTFIHRDPKVAEGLERYKKHGKVLFILTNSDFHYTKALLEYAIDPFLKDHKNWMELFDYTITSARKPRFFYDQTPFLKINPADGTMTNYDHTLVPGIYQGGCADLFEKSLHVHGDEILYIGDHIYGDIVRLKKDCRWRTALVIEELADELSKMQAAIPSQDKINELMNKKAPLEQIIVEVVTKEIENQTKNPELLNKTQQQISDIDQEIRPLIQKIQSMFNPQWGEIMRAGNEESYFAHQVNRFADIYMSELVDLLKVSPRTYFRSQRRHLAHEQSLRTIIEEL